ncbi:MAG: gamma-glutamylcyclotransferase [Romboutsia sp.]|nr:gamma-glutamylcyclotransferase [Romboutsia sp.]
MICERCSKETNTFTVSMFNTQNICMECKDEERKHPRYKEACDKELEEVKKGNYNFEGIGF